VQKSWLLRRAFKLGAKHKPPKVTVASIPAFSKLDESAVVRQGFLEYSDFIKLRDELPGEVRPILVYARHTGCRRGEIISLQWSQVDLEAGMGRLRASETKGRKGANHSVNR